MICEECGKNLVCINCDGLEMLIERDRYAVIWREGSTGRDNDNRYIIYWEDPEMIRFKNLEELTKWKKKLDDKISPVGESHKINGGYIWQLIYAGNDNGISIVKP